MAELLTREGQYEFRGWLFGTATGYPVDNIEGLDLPDLRTSDVERFDDHGATFGRDLLAPRIVRATVGVAARDAADARLRQGVIAEAMAPMVSGSAALTWRLPGEATRRVLARPRRYAFPWVDVALLGAGVAVLEWVAADPRMYDDNESTRTITAAADATTASGSARNEGNFGTRPVLSLVGPARNPRFRNDETNEEIKVDLDVSAAQTLVVDTDARTVELDGVDRYDAVRSDNEWWELGPGATQVTYTRGLGAGTASSALTVTWRSAWVA